MHTKSPLTKEHQEPRVVDSERCHPNHRKCQDPDLCHVTDSHIQSIPLLGSLFDFASRVGMCGLWEVIKGF